MASWTLHLPEPYWLELYSHLFPGNGDEHAAVIAAGYHRVGERTRLLAHRVFLARDGVDYVASRVAHRQLRPGFIRRCIRFCRDNELAYLAAHCHGGRDSVAFSSVDLASHERGYPALRDISRGQVVGGLVFARRAVAGHLWLPDGSRMQLECARVAGHSIWDLHPRRGDYPSPLPSDDRHHRQALIFGDLGQRILGQLWVGLIGLGGIGSLVIEYLVHLGVRRFVLCDPQRIDRTNLPRVVGSEPGDWVQQAPEQSLLKVHIAERLIKRIAPDAEVVRISGDFVDDSVARRFLGCDYLFLCADTFQARLVFNAIVHQYLIPGVQLGSKVQVDRESGRVEQIYCSMRPVLPGAVCLHCNGLIPADRLQFEAASEEEAGAQRYVDEPTVTAPSVITLNALAASYAANELMMAFTGLRRGTAPPRFVRFLPQESRVRFVEPRQDPNCPECGSQRGRLGLGDACELPTRPR